MFLVRDRVLMADLLACLSVGMSINLSIAYKTLIFPPRVFYVNCDKDLAHSISMRELLDDG